MRSFGMSTELARNHVEAADLRCETSLPGGGTFERGPAQRVLLVDDAEGAIQMMARLLTLAGYEVALAHEGEAAISAALHVAPQMIVLDLNLPDMSGFDVARRLRQHRELDGVLLIALTGNSDEESRAAATAAGFDQYVVKPAGIDVFEALLRQHGARNVA